MTHSNGSFGKRNMTRPSEPARAVSQPAHEEQGTTLNAGFMATVAAVFVAVSSGTFFYLNGGLSLPQFALSFNQAEPAYTSSVDRACGKGWQKELPNTDQMHCYLTSSPKRLCEPGERAHLVATIDRFEEDYGVWSSRLFAASLGTIAKVQVNSIQMGMDTAEMTKAMNDPTLSDEERMKKIEKVQNEASEALAGPNAVIAERVNTVLSAGI